MHELSMAAAIADIVGRHARGRRVTRVEVAIGHLRQAAPAALSFGFQLASTGTSLEGAKLAIRQVPLRGCCRLCGEQVEPETWPLACPGCSSFELAISGGEELCVEAIEVDCRDSDLELLPVDWPVFGDEGVYRQEGVFRHEDTDELRLVPANA